MNTKKEYILVDLYDIFENENDLQRKKNSDRIRNIIFFLSQND